MKNEGKKFETILKSNAPSYLKIVRIPDPPQSFTQRSDTRFSRPNPYDYEARANLMLASSYSHNGLTGLGKKQLMRVHALEHILSGCYDEVAHGEGLAILWPSWCYYVLKNNMFFLCMSFFICIFARFMYTCIV